MLTYNDEQRVRQIIKDEVPDIVNKAMDRIEIKIDKVLKIVTRTDQEHKLTQAKLNKLEKRTVKIEKKLKIKPPSESVIFT